jgi:peptidoglycan glycosyltransferase
MLRSDCFREWLVGTTTMMDKQLKRLFCFTVILFAALAAMLTWYQFFRAKELWAHPFNPRRASLGKSVLRGGFYDRTGEPLTVYTKDGTGIGRNYLLNSLAHVIGYADPRYGTAGLESAFDSELSGSITAIELENVIAAVTGRSKAGADITLTIDRRIQEVAAATLAGRRGAVIVMDPLNGDILAMVSNPGFDPNNINKDWFWIAKDERQPFLNRATVGFYPPGSTFKPLIAMAAADVWNGTTIDCGGKTTVDGRQISEPRLTAHGEVDLNTAMAVSCNVAFVEWGLQAGWSAIRETCRRFGIGEETPFILPLERSRLPSGKISAVELAETSIGQGRLQMTPLSMALAICGIANEGVIMAPRLVKQVSSRMGLYDANYPAVVWHRAASAGLCRQVTAAMQSVIEWGTGQRAAIPGVTVAGKTGSAENPHGISHAWFVGFAPAEAPRAVVTVIVENAGSGGTVAAPIAKEVLQAALARR